ncbi:MAG: hypothetical protein LUO98_05745 [Methanoregula sp.]|nr:hypothetical protein [Methanoregula sp.]
MIAELPKNYEEASQKEGYGGRVLVVTGMLRAAAGMDFLLFFFWEAGEEEKD